VQKELAEVNFPLSLQLFSSVNKTGVDEIHQVLDQWFSQNEYEEVAENNEI
jgi:GTP-binding protein